MAKPTTAKIRLVSTADTGYFYVTKKNTRTMTEKLTVLINRVEAAKENRRCPTQDEFIADLARVKVGVEDHTAFVGELLALNPDADLVTFPTSAKVVEALRAGDVSISFDGEIGTLQHLAEDRSLHIFALYCELPGWHEDIAVAVNGDQPALVPFIDLLLDRIHLSIENGEVTFIDAPWNSAR